ncbi:ATP-binding cassette domain-containing protein, partial [bacterium]|nr:ATP-binding cassette domain-containing protein [bacterium]
MKITAQNLVKVYGDRSVVNDVSFEVNQGEVVGLLGPNGAGKTTTFYMIVGLVKANEGKVFLDDQDITDMPMHLRGKLGIGYLPQEPSIFRKLSIEDNLKLVLEMNDKLNKQEKEDLLESLLDEFGIQKIRKYNA